MGISIVLASQKGGGGKTTSAVNLATALSIGGYRVLLIDLDPQGSVNTALGIPTPATSLGSSEIFLNPEYPVSHLAQSCTEFRLDVISSNMWNLDVEQQALRAAKNSKFLADWIEQQALSYDFVIMDPPAGANHFTLNALVAADLVIAPLQCEPLAVQSLKRFIHTFQELQAQVGAQLRIAGVLLTMYEQQQEVHRIMYRQIKQLLDESLFKTVIPKCPHILQSSVSGQSVIQRQFSAVGATAYIKFANELLDRFELRVKAV